MATLITVYAHISFASIEGIGWRWAGVIWLYSLVFYVPMDPIKFTIRYILSGEAWNLLFDRKVSVDPELCMQCNELCLQMTITN